MLIYYILVLFVVVCMISGNEKTYPNKNLKVLFLLIYCITAFRSFSIGTDTKSYIEEFVSGDYFLRGVDVGFSYFNYWLHEIGLSPRLYLMAATIIIILPVFAFISRYSQINKSFTVLLYLTIGNFTFNLAGMRQSLAIAFILIGLVLFKRIERTLPKYIIVISAIYLAYMFHYTAIVCVLIIPLLWFSDYRFPKDKKLIKILLIALPIIIMYSTKYVANVVDFFTISKYEYYETVFGDANVISYIVIPYCIYLYTLFLYYRSNSSDWEKNFCFYCSIIYMCIAACTLYMPMLGRFEYYFSMPLICLIANLTMELPLSKRQLFVLAISIVCMAFFLISTPGGTLRIDNYSFF